MLKEDAIKVLNQLEAVCIKHKLWYTVETEKKPELSMIRIKEISIKIEK